MKKKYGVTMHLMSKKVESGKIIKVKYFSSKNLSLLNLINKSYEHMYKLFVQEMNYFFKNKNFKFSKEKWKRKAYRRIDLNNLCKLSLKMGREKFIQRLKAVYHRLLTALFFNKREEIFSNTQPMKKTLIIAEAGVNHNGSLKKCLQLIDIAKKVGADIVKFQTLKLKI